MSAFLIIGAGFAGAVYARSLADAGHLVTVVDRRDHIAGNAFDYVDQNGVRVHRYGPHLFHTNNETVFRWVQRFGEWVNYEHRVRARLDNGVHVPLPINRQTLEAIFGRRLPTESSVIELLQEVSEPSANITDAGGYLRSRIGSLLTDVFFRPYTRKMWGLELEEMSASVVKRIPIRMDDDDRYFPDDQFQILPKSGYTNIFSNILDHKNIKIFLSTAYHSKMEHGFAHCFNSMPIDEFFEFKFGELPYRSIRFHSETRNVWSATGWSVTNYTDSGPYTRETYWHALPEHHVSRGKNVTVTVEEPCDYKENSYERYYPVKSVNDLPAKLYERYKELSKNNENMTFIGRCGTYQYLDMHQVINQSLIGVKGFLSTLS